MERDESYDKSMLRKILDDLENTNSVYAYNEELDNGDGVFHSHVSWLLKNKYLAIDEQTRNISDLTEEGRSLLNELNMELGYMPRKNSSPDSTQVIGVDARDAHDFAFDHCMDLIDLLIEDLSTRGQFSFHIRDGIWAAEDPDLDEIRREIMDDLENRGFKCEWITGFAEESSNGLSVKWIVRPADAVPLMPDRPAPGKPADPFAFGKGDVDALGMADQMIHDQKDLEMRQKRKAALAQASAEISEREIEKAGAQPAPPQPAPQSALRGARTGAQMSREEIANQVLK